MKAAIGGERGGRKRLMHERVDGCNMGTECSQRARSLVWIRCFPCVIEADKVGGMSEDEIGAEGQILGMSTSKGG